MICVWAGHAKYPSIIYLLLLVFFLQALHLQWTPGQSWVAVDPARFKAVEVGQRKLQPGLPGVKAGLQGRDIFLGSLHTLLLLTRPVCSPVDCYRIRGCYRDLNIEGSDPEKDHIRSSSGNTLNVVLDLCWCASPSLSYLSLPWKSHYSPRHFLFSVCYKITYHIPLISHLICIKR